MSRWLGITIAALFFTTIAAAQPEKLPAVVDLRPEFDKLKLSPHHQGTRDVCSLFAITSLADFESARQVPDDAKRLSEEFLTWAANEATGRKGDQAMFYEAVHGLNQLGICTEELMSFGKLANPTAKPSAAALAVPSLVSALRRTLP